MNAAANPIANESGIEAGADERIVDALLEKGRLKEADLGMPLQFVNYRE